jgi:glutamate-1-semialdehyde 2,1-aminomutase
MNHDVSVTTDAVPFNDIAAVERVLSRGRTAAVIAEPVMTNIGMVLPQEGFLRQLREVTRRLNVLLIIDETHTLSTARGGYARAQDLEPDIWVCGKAIAGGMLCAVFGFTADVEVGMRRVQEDRAGGHSGMGTTLAANALALACLGASLDDLMTPANYQAMHDCATYLSEGLGRVFAAETLRGTWRVGARLEFGFPARPRAMARSPSARPGPSSNTPLSLLAESRRPAYTVPQHDAVFARHHHPRTRIRCSSICTPACVKWQPIVNGLADKAELGGSSPRIPTFTRCRS